MIEPKLHVSLFTAVLRLCQAFSGRAYMPWLSLFVRMYSGATMANSYYFSTASKQLLKDFVGAKSRNAICSFIATASSSP
jgi:uncharacterized protein YqiB (DUF1249 family)